MSQPDRKLDLLLKWELPDGRYCLTRDQAKEPAAIIRRGFPGCVKASQQNSSVTLVHLPGNRQALFRTRKSRR
jgi:hypothetical protein